MKGIKFETIIACFSTKSHGIDCLLGSNGFMQLVNAFLNIKTIPLRELHLPGNNITANQMSYLINQLHLNLIRHSHSSQQSSPFIFPSLKVLNLNGK